MLFTNIVDKTTLADWLQGPKLGEYTNQNYGYSMEDILILKCIILSLIIHGIRFKTDEKPVSFFLGHPVLC